jgi:uncharacterized membrane protein YdjX (TVP38/TMEM64 family)
MALISLLVPPLGALVLLGFLEPLRNVVRAWPVLGPVACVALFCLCAGLALLPTAVLAIFAGWAFGFAAGYPVALAGFTGAAVLGYVVARRASGRRVVDLVAESPRWQAVHRTLLGSGWWRTFWIVALLRLPVVPPFAATTVALAALRCRWWPFAAGTLAGIAPRTAAYVYFAGRARDLALGDVRIDPWFTAVSFVTTLAVLVTLGLLARRALRRLVHGAPYDGSSSGTSPA